jgi:acyl carrier protein
MSDATGDGRVDRGVRSVLADVFGLAPEDIDTDTSKDTVDGWDSVQHLTVVLALEEEFGVQFDDEESVSLVTFPLIVAIVEDRLGATEPS